MGRHILSLCQYPAVVANNWTLIANFFRRDLLGRFRGSLLGIFWVLVQPIFLFAIYYFVFGFLLGPKTGTGGPDVGFAFYLFSGIVAFTAMTESTTRSCNVILENGNLVKKVAFPCELLPVPNILVSLIVYAVGVTVLMSTGLWQSQINPGIELLVWPLVLVVHCAMCLGLGLLLACLQVLMRDTFHLYSIGQQAWFFLSPVFWPLALFEGKLGEHAWVVELNPMYSLIQAHRYVFGFGGHDYMLHADGTPLPGIWYHLGFAALWATFFLVIGYSFFMSRKNKFADLV